MIKERSYSFSCIQWWLSRKNELWSQLDCPNPNTSFSSLCWLWSFWAQFASLINQRNKVKLHVLPRTQPRGLWTWSFVDFLLWEESLGWNQPPLPLRPWLLCHVWVSKTSASDRHTSFPHPGNFYEQKVVLMVLYLKKRYCQRIT